MASLLGNCKKKYAEFHYRFRTQKTFQLKATLTSEKHWFIKKLAIVTTVQHGSLVIAKRSRLNPIIDLGHWKHFNLKPHLHQKSIVNKKASHSSNSWTWLGSLVSAKIIWLNPISEWGHGKHLRVKLHLHQQSIVFKKLALFLGKCKKKKS